MAAPLKNHLDCHFNCKGHTVTAFFRIFILMFLLAGCGYPLASQDALANTGSTSPTPVNGAHTVLQTGRQMAVIDRLILPGACWDYANAVYTRAGYPPAKRKTVFKGDKDKGPYADTSLVKPGDWLYFSNHRYGGTEHSAIFVEWIDFEKKKGLMLSYGGENRREPARYLSYRLNRIYRIVRPKSR